MELLKTERKVLVRLFKGLDGDSILCYFPLPKEGISFSDFLSQNELQNSNCIYELGRMKVSKDSETILNDGNEINIYRNYGEGDTGKIFTTILLTLATAAAVALTAGLAAPAFVALGASLLAAEIMAGVAAGVVTIAGSMVSNAIIKSFYPPEKKSLPAAQQNMNLQGGRNQNRIRQNEPYLLIIGKTQVVPDIIQRPQVNYLYNNYYEKPVGELEAVFSFGINKCSLENSDPFSVYIHNFKYQGAGEKIDGNPSKDSSIVESIHWARYSGGGMSAQSPYKTTTDTLEKEIFIDIPDGAYQMYITVNGYPNGYSDKVSLFISYVNGPFIGRATVICSGKTPYTIKQNTFNQALSSLYELEKRKIFLRAKSENNDNKVSFSIDSIWFDYTNVTTQNLGSKFVMSLSFPERLTSQNWTLKTTASAKARRPDIGDSQSHNYYPTSNPADWIYELLRGRDSRYGAGLEHEEIDVESLIEFRKFCEKNELTVNGVIGTKQSLLQTLNSIAFLGFGSITWESGKIGVTWEDLDRKTDYVFTPDNIIQDSFLKIYSHSRTREEVIIKYNDKDKNYDLLVARESVDGKYKPNFTELPVWGCDNKILATKIARRMLAKEIYAGDFYEFETDLESFYLRVNDIITIRDVLRTGHESEILIMKIKRNKNGNSIITGFEVSEDYKYVMKYGHKPKKDYRTVEVEY